MITEKNILTRIRAADTDAPVGAYAVEIPDNRYVVGNLNSQHMYNQTKEEDNGAGSMDGFAGEMNKKASVYLEKIANMAALKSWPKRLIKDIKDAPPLNQLGLAGGAVFGLGKAKGGYESHKSSKHHANLEERSLKALHKINKNLGQVAVVPSVKV